MNKLQIVNEILSQLRESSVTSLNHPKLKEFPWNNVDDLLDEATMNFSNRATWNWTLTETQLNYTPELNKFCLTDYNIDYNRVLNVYYILGTYPVIGFYELDLMNRQKFKRDFPNWMTLGKPLIYSQEDDNLFVYPIPDADYKIIVKHYRQLPLLKTGTDSIAMIPEMYQRAVIYEVSATLAVILGKNNAESLNMNCIEVMGNATKANQTFLQSPNKQSSRIKWS